MFLHFHEIFFPFPIFEFLSQKADFYDVDNKSG